MLAYVLLTFVTVGVYPAMVLVSCTGFLLVRIQAGHAGVAELVAIAIAALLVGLVGVIAVTRGTSVAFAMCVETARLRRWVQANSMPLCSEVENALAELDKPRRVVAVDAAEHMALTIGSFRPTVVFSKGLYDALPARQFRSVLIHEITHARRRDPLRLFVIRVLAAHLWFLPGVREIRDRIECSYELTADWNAAQRYGSSAVAGALLSFVQPPSGPRVGASFHRRCYLTDRVAQMECGYATRPSLAATNLQARTALCAAGFTSMTSLVLVLSTLLCAGGAACLLSWF